MNQPPQPTAKSSISLRLAPGFGTVLFILLAVTGNCHCNGCGFDKDYVEMWSR